MRRIYWRFAFPAALLACTLLLMWRNSVRDPGPTRLPGDMPNWHNRPGDLALNVRFVLIEAIIALVILRPWSYDRSWRRALAAVLLFAPWLAMNLLFLIHSGGIMVLHTLWLVVIWLVFVGAVVRSGASAAGSARSTSSEAPPDEASKPRGRQEFQNSRVSKP